MFQYRYVFLLAITAHLTVTDKGPCTRFYKECCPNTRWDPVAEACVVCSTGYFWINCSKPCPYPTYGERCLQNCSCDNETCDFMSGCTFRNVTGLLCRNETTNMVTLASSAISDSILFKLIMAALASLGSIALAYFTVAILEKFKRSTSKTNEEPMYQLNTV
ncbi:multiple epidermal growth factor-like domains protein 10 [Ostrea edulis]|uniref:multiple epidermal growth factor-like domains protein 10 n=1 Tax=Ostrea edulis TaxID=37623 RepID=UPI0024AFDB31|nr:multiple epidermal growth factor-like domains protein 10 [Ostrea edulis]